MAAGHHDSAGMDAAEDVRRIPITLLTRIMHRALPRYTNINDDANEAVSLCVAEFARAVIHEAARMGKMESRRTVSGEDIIIALDCLGFNDYVGPLTLLLHRYRESQGIVPRGWQAEMASPAPAAAQVEVQQQNPPSVEVVQPQELDLTLGLAPPAPRDVTELGLHEDVYKAWPRFAGAIPPPPAGGNKQ
jgi:nuclear transcription Y subunit beta